MSGSTLIKGGYIIAGADRPDIERGDVLIVDGRIAQIGEDIAAQADEVVDATGLVVTPGFIDTHRHTWQTALRNSMPDGALDDYSMEVILKGQFFTPEDVHTSTLLGLLGALDSGITTLLDWSHISNTPEHSDAAVQAIKDSGIRGVYAHGFGIAPPEKWLGPDNVTPHPEDLRRIVETHHGSPDGLLTVAAALRGPEFASYEAAWNDIRFARELGIRMTIHTGAGAFGVRNTVEGVRDAGLLGPDITYVHTNTSSDEALSLIAESGGSVSTSPIVEAIMGHGPTAYARLRKAGIRPSLSVDTEAGSPGDMFSVMRAAYTQARAASNALGQQSQGSADEGRQIFGIDEPREDLPTVREVFGWATIDGARTLGLEDHVGSLEVGKQADLAMLDLGGVADAPLNNALGAVVHNGTAAAVKHVLVAGSFVKRDGQLVSTLVDRVVAESQTLSGRLTESMAAAMAAMAAQAN